MKTLKIILVCFITSLAVTTATAQNAVVKTEFTGSVNGQYYDCLGEYIGGDLTFDVMLMSHNFIGKFKKGTVLGYLDANGQFPSGKEYEVSQVLTGSDFNQNILLFRLNGKIVLEMHMTFRIITNANGDVTATIDKTIANCKD